VGLLELRVSRVNKDHVEPMEMLVIRVLQELLDPLERKALLGIKE